MRRTVVGAVIAAEGLVLAARRARPADIAGYWEFPGGKVEPGEDPRLALIREIDEELAITIEVYDEISPTPWPISDQYVLRLYLASIVSGEPLPGPDHDELRWLAPDDLEALEWLPSDYLALPAVRRALRSWSLSTP